MNSTVKQVVEGFFNAPKETNQRVLDSGKITPVEDKAWLQYLSEREAAEQAMKGAEPSFHYGYKNVMISQGFDAYGGDSQTTFKAKDGAFWFTASSWNDWRISDTVKVDRTGKKLNARSEDSFKASVVRLGMADEDFMPKEKERPKYTQYEIRDTGAQYWSESLMGTFDDLETAKAKAWKWAQDEIDKGMQGYNYRYYNSKPYDMTKYHEPALLWLEYYDYSGTTYGIEVLGITK